VVGIDGGLPEAAAKGVVSARPPITTIPATGEVKPCVRWDRSGGPTRPASGPGTQAAWLLPFTPQVGTRSQGFHFNEPIPLEEFRVLLG